MGVASTLLGEPVLGEPRRTAATTVPTAAAVGRPARKLRIFADPNPYLRELQASYHGLVRTEEDERYARHESFPGVRLDKGALFVGDLPILHPEFEQDTVSWSQWTNGEYSCGVLHFLAGGRAFSGTISRGPDPEHATATKVAGSVPPSVYRTQVAKQGGEEALPQGPWEENVTLEIGFTADPEPAVVVKLDGTEWPAVYEKINPENQNLQVYISFDATLTPEAAGLQPSWPAEGMLEFSMDARTASGYLRKFDPGTQQPGKQEFAWRARLAPENVTADVVPLPRPRRIVQADLLATDANLSLVDLMTVGPDPGEVQKLSFEILLENMKWAIGGNPDEKDWLNDFFGERRPVLTQQRTDLINKNLSFYTDDFAKAYLGLSVSNISGEGAPTTKLTDAQMLKLKYFLTNGLGQTPGYSMQQQGIYLQAFLAKAPRLQKYLDDGGEKWAQRLYDELMTPAQLNMMINRMLGAKSSALANRFSTLLAILQPSGELATQYHSNVVTRLLSQIALSARLDDKQAIMEWLPDVIQQFITSYIEDPEDKGNAEQLARQALAQDLKDAANQVGNITKLADAFADALIAVRGANVLKTGETAYKNFARNHPRLAKAAKFLKFGAFTGGLFYAIVGFQDWKNLSDTQKASLIVTTVSLTGDLLLAVPDILEGTSWSLNQLVKMQNFLSRKTSAQALVDGMEAVETGWLKRGARNMSAFITDTVLAEESRFFKFFAGAAEILEYLGPVSAAAFAVLAEINFLNDLTNGAGVAQTVLDGIIAAASYGEAFMLTMSLVSTSEFFGPAGAVLAVIGMVLMLVEMFLPQKKPETPAEKFVKNVLVPYTNQLKAPPKDWQPPQTEKSASG